MLPSQRDLRDTSEFKGRVFDVQPSRDDKSLSYPVRPLLATAVNPVRKVWRRGAVLDQGQEGACVGHGVVGELTSAPAPVRFADIALPAGAPRTQQGMAFWLYEQAKRIDEYPGTEYSGTSVNAGMKMARSLGLISGWRWGHTMLDLRDAIITAGPVVIAIPWFNGMYSAPGGELRVTGSFVGWHCLLVNGYDPALAMNGKGDREMYRLLNSWGTGWGNYGSAWMEASALSDLLIGWDGEIAVPLGRTLIPA
jgi:hypothetical protein